MRRVMLLTFWAAFLVVNLSWEEVGGAVAQGETRPVVVISPGHGWWDPDSKQIDPGATVDEVKEKDINLEVAEYARELLRRCPLVVHLTRDQDDPNHTLADVDEIVNALMPDLGISIHSNSGSGSGPEGWHTVGGFDDDASQELAARLAANVAAAVALPDRGIIPETSSRHGGLYIHYWQAPSALLELGYMQADRQVLADRRRDLARGVAAGILTHLNIPATCADQLDVQGMPLAAALEGEVKTFDVKLINDGVTTWDPQAYGLRHEKWVTQLDGLRSLPYPVRPGAILPMSFTVTAPAKPGLHTEVWHLYTDGREVEEAVQLRLFVVPKEAGDLRDRFETQIAEWRAKGEQEIERLIGELTRQLSDWLAQQVEKEIGITCPNPALIAGLLFAGWHARWGRRQK